MYCLLCTLCVCFCTFFLLLKISGIFCVSSVFLVFIVTLFVCFGKVCKWHHLNMNKFSLFAILISLVKSPLVPTHSKQYKQFSPFVVSAIFRQWQKYQIYASVSCNQLQMNNNFLLLFSAFCHCQSKTIATKAHQVLFCAVIFGACQK